MEAAVNKREFDEAYRQLQRSYESAGENTMSYNVTSCRHCAACHFCQGCEACYRCTYCNDLVTCSHCTHCERSENCHSCAYCLECKNCSGSQYLILCEACSDCTYCFGSIGMQKKDFHILNEPYDRTAYFEITKGLKKAFGIKG